VLRVGPLQAPFAAPVEDHPTIPSHELGPGSVVVVVLKAAQQGETRDRSTARLVTDLLHLRVDPVRPGKRMPSTAAASTGLPHCIRFGLFPGQGMEKFQGAARRPPWGLPQTELVPMAMEVPCRTQAQGTFDALRIH